jgi:hypothetical protein
MVMLSCSSSVSFIMTEVSFTMTKDRIYCRHFIQGIHPAADFLSRSPPQIPPPYICVFHLVADPDWLHPSLAPASTQPNSSTDTPRARELERETLSQLPFAFHSSLEKACELLKAHSPCVRLSLLSMEDHNGGELPGYSEQKE